MEENRYDYYVGIKFSRTTHAYFFGAKNLPLQVGDKVVVETMHGPELGEVTLEPIPIEKYKSELELKPILRKATDVDVRLAEINQKDAVYALEICQVESKKLNLASVKWYSHSIIFLRKIKRETRFFSKRCRPLVYCCLGCSFTAPFFPARRTLTSDAG